ncbi:MAG: bifunctional phosphopantothenoylcysteine decarboxylase/phosphopantothenate--cysteine ligase CoaBC [Calditrichaeota bacterium]|nr:bifunctional phosphopantothenoylcysteine decarboxylase/phosphopantothenate--cysteine ligase CoaBC [Calditrichota bacterium]
MFANKNILVGVTGGIAAYKSCEIIREIKKNGGNVRVVMTPAATKFITPLTLATLSENPVLMDMFADEFGGSTIHIESARWADAILTCPATANTIGKIASGISDNLLTTLVMAATVPVLLCPAMNKEMYRNMMFVENVAKLKKAGYIFVDADEGELACGEVGEGRLAETHKIMFALRKALFGKNVLSGKKILVTAGRTEEDLDPVRFLTNRSSGKMGYAIAEAAAIAGGEVTLVSGPTQLPIFSAGKFISVRTAAEIAAATEKEFPKQDVVVMAAAVADFRPEQVSAHKLKKDDARLTLNLARTRDILQWMGKRKGDKCLVGFALETENEVQNALGKLRQKNLDLIVVNNPLTSGAGFAHSTNVVTIIDKSGNQEQLPLMSKFEVASQLVDRIANLLTKN